MALNRFASIDGVSGSTTSGTLNKYLGAPKVSSGPVPSSGTPWAPRVAPAPAPRTPAINYNQPSYIGSGIAPAPRATSTNYNQQSFIGSGVGPAPSTNNFVGGGGGGGPVNPPRPPRTYDSFTDQEAATDSTFTDQKSAYANALKKFIEDNDRQKGILETDAGIAQKGIERNKTNGLTGLSEDFASRGLSNSGMFRGELDNASDQYGKQKEQVTMGLKNGTDDLGFRRAKYEQENGENGTNIQAARREAFARLAASQGLT